MDTDSIIFGPINSRRFGRSLGIDLSPMKKQCNFDCLYCELEKKKAENAQSEHLDIGVIEAAARRAIASYDFDVLTFTANGEPTLYSDIGELHKRLLPYLREVRGGAKTLLLTNGANLLSEPLLLDFDIIKFSMDAYDEKTFKRINKPYPSIIMERIREDVRRCDEIYKGTLIAEILLVEGVNDSALELERTASFLRSLKNLARLDISSIDRPPAYDVRRCDDAHLGALADLFYGINVTLPKRGRRHDLTLDISSPQDILALLGRRPLSVEECEYILTPAGLETLRGCEEEGSCWRKSVCGVEFYTTRS